VDISMITPNPVSSCTLGALGDVFGLFAHSFSIWSTAFSTCSGTNGVLGAQQFVICSNIVVLKIYHNGLLMVALTNVSEKSFEIFFAVPDAQ